MSARRTPYEAVFRNARYEAEIFPAIRAQAAAHHANDAVPDEILLLEAAGVLLRELPPDLATQAEYLPPAAALREYGALVFHAYRYWSWGRRTLVVDEALTRALLAREERLGEWALAPPHPAGYLQLPRHLLWAKVDPDATPEAVDGFFWSAGGQPNEATLQRLDLLFVLGIRPDRPGFSVIELDVPLPAEPPGHWGDIRGRDDAPDFANVLPGGELRGLHSMVSVAEALKLVSRLFHYIAHHPAAVAAAQLGAESAGGEGASSIPASEVTLVNGGT